MSTCQGLVQESKSTRENPEPHGTQGDLQELSTPTLIINEKMLYFTDTHLEDVWSELAHDLLLNCLLKLNEPNWYHLFLGTFNEEFKFKNLSYGLLRASLSQILESRSEDVLVSSNQQNFNFYGFLKASEILSKFECVVSFLLLNSAENNKVLGGLKPKIKAFMFWRNFLFDLLFDQFDALNLSFNNPLTEWMVQEMIGATFGKTLCNVQQQRPHFIPNNSTTSDSSNIINKKNYNSFVEKGKLLAEIAKLGFFHSTRKRVACVEQSAPLICDILHTRLLCLGPMIPYIHIQGNLHPSSLFTQRIFEAMFHRTFPPNDAHFVADARAFDELLENLLSSCQLIDLVRQHSKNHIQLMQIMHNDEAFNEVRQNFVMFVLNTLRIEYTFAFYAQKKKSK